MAERIPILVVDDDPDFLELVSYNLRLAGFSVSIADNGPTALELARHYSHAVILLDTTMPGMDGLEVLSELRHDPATESIPVFMLTAKTQLGDIDRAFDIGANDYISKPVELTRLGAIVKAKLAKLSVSPKSK
jgi:DNA-binding response OmpR family regulator